MSKNDGGPAFPVDDAYAYEKTGMTMRDDVREQLRWPLDRRIAQ